MYPNVGVDRSVETHPLEKQQEKCSSDGTTPLILASQRGNAEQLVEDHLGPRRVASTGEIGGRKKVMIQVFI